MPGAWLGALAPAGVFLATLWLSGRVRRWLGARAILDRPGERSSHREPVPRGGGLALVPILLLAWLALAIGDRAPSGTIAVAILAGALAGLSWLDDLRGLPIAVRLAAHVAAVALGILTLPSGAVFQGWLPPVLDAALAGLLWLWFVNLFNFMDGIDGLAGIETAALGLGVAVVVTVADPGHDGIAGLALCVAADALGFLRWNWHPAKLFLGDSGSVPLGFMLGWLLLLLAAKGLWAPAVILPLYYLADATATLLRRLGRGEPFWRAHRQHFYQRALAPDGNHAAVAGLVLAADVLLLVAAVLALAWPLAALAFGGVVVAALLLLLQRRARRTA